MKTKLTIIIILIAVNHCFAQIVNGYTDKVSYRAGDTVTFFTKHTNSNSGPTSFFLMDIALNDTITMIGGFTRNIQSGLPNYSTTNPWEDGFGYTPTNTWIVPDTIPSGYYQIGRAS